LETTENNMDEEMENGFKDYSNDFTLNLRETVQNLTQKLKKSGKK